LKPVGAFSAFSLLTTVVTGVDFTALPFASKAVATREYVWLPGLGGVGKVKVAVVALKAILESRTTGVREVISVRISGPRQDFGEVEGHDGPQAASVLAHVLIRVVGAVWAWAALTRTTASRMADSFFNGVPLSELARTWPVAP
jgi:hypothetical protein